MYEKNIYFWCENVESIILIKANIMKQKAIILSTIVAILFLGSTSIYAQHNEDHSEHRSTTHFSKHHIAIYNGLTTSFAHEVTAYTVGLDYEYRFSKLLGLGVLGEYIFVDSKESVI